MRTAVAIGGVDRHWDATVDYVREAEQLGVDVAWSAEAWGSDAATPLAYLAAVTERIELGSGILQISARSAVMTAQTALTLHTISGGRFLLGLGASGPQVVEGLHGQPFDHPLGRMRETIEIVRLAASGERIAYQGRHIELPRPGGQGKALRLALPPVPDLPIYLATLSPKMLELTGELADGWLGTSFVPERADAFYEHIDRGAARSGRRRSDLDISQGGEVAFGDDVDAMVASRKRGLAFSLGGMGSATTNFYNDAYSRQGFADAAAEVQELWVQGRHEDAVAAVPDEMVLATTMIGTDAMVRDRMRAWRDAGITTLRLYPAGATLDDRLDTLGRALDLVRDIDREHDREGDR